MKKIETNGNQYTVLSAHGSYLNLRMEKEPFIEGIGKIENNLLSLEGGKPRPYKIIKP